jgi:fermentation-respiration switch protein FrsA (DUF1100 family)
MGPIMVAPDAGFKAAIFYVSGLILNPVGAVVDPFNFAPRVRTPVLMINARHDHLFPLATSAQPLFEHLGSVQKEFYLSEGGHFLGTGSHFVPRDELKRETLRWLDRHLGPVR